MSTKLCLLCCVFTVVFAAVLFTPVATLRVKGNINFKANGKFVYSLARFGVKKGHSVYGFGFFHRNPSIPVGYHSQMILAFVPQRVWDDFYRATKEFPNNCEEIVNSTLYESMNVVDENCVSGMKDYIRKVPCSPSESDEGSLICNQPKDTALVEDQEISYRVESVSQTEYYHALVVACTRNTSKNCLWASSDDTYMEYDFHIVGTKPDDPGHKNPFVYQFPYEYQGVLILQIIFIMLYVVISTIHVILHTRLCNDKGYRPHNLIRLFTISLFFEMIHVALEMIHYSVYAHNGIGVIAFKYLGEVCNQFSDWLMILVLILIGKGWQVTTSTIRWKLVTFLVWGFYIFFSAAYFTWVVLQDYVYPLNLYTNHTFQSWPGGFYLSYRLFVLLYSLYEMRQMYLIEMRTTALRLYILLGVAYIIWFCYLPLIVFITALVNALERYKVILTFILTFDFSINVFLILLFCPRWSSKYFQFDNYINFFPRVGSSYKSLKEYGGTRKTSQTVVI